MQVIVPVKSIPTEDEMDRAWDHFTSNPTPVAQQMFCDWLEEEISGNIDQIVTFDTIMVDSEEGIMDLDDYINMVFP